MSQHGSTGLKIAKHHTHASMDVDDVLAMLHETIARIESPVVQECLKEACCEIAHLTSSEGGSIKEYEELHHHESEEHEHCHTLRIAA